MEQSLDAVHANKDMMSNLVMRLKRLVLAIFGLFRRAMCCFRRSRRNSGMILPVTNEKPSPTVDYNQISSQYSSVSTTNRWQHGLSYNSQQQQGQQPYNSNPESLVTQVEPDDQAEPDFFTEMAPSIKRQKKVRLNNTAQDSAINSAKFGVVDLGPSIPSHSTSELGTLEDQSYSGGYYATNDVSNQAYGHSADGDAWESEPVDIESSLREAREMERKRRLAEHQRLKEQKEKERKQRHSKSLATKIS